MSHRFVRRLRPDQSQQAASAASRWSRYCYAATTVPIAGARHVRGSLRRRMQVVRSLRAARLSGAAGMTTAEYAVGTLAACAFAAVLIAVVRAPEVRSALSSVITAALHIAS